MATSPDFWDHPYYRLVKLLATVTGTWPRQSLKEIIMYRFAIFVVVVIQVTPQIVAFWKYRDNMEIILETISPFIIDLALTVKFMNAWWFFKRSTYLLEQIRENWNIFPRNNGRYMLHYHSEFARKLSLVYLAGVYMAGIVFSTEPLQQRALSLLLHTNITAPNRFSMPMDFGSINLDVWYYPLFLMSGVCIIIIITVIGSCDLMFLMYAEHACGLFKGLGYAIIHLPPHDPKDRVDYGFEYMRKCAIIHRRVIDFAEDIKDIFMWSFLGIIGLNMIIISVTAVQVMINLKSMEKIVKFILFVSMQMVHLFVECFVAQRLMDASFELTESLTNANWYNASRKTQRLIPIMLMRSQNPIILTAGKIIVMNMNTYAVVLKTAASYFTVFLAMQ
ncbi:odorant receptor 82a isoform X2 [Fopius arisanus]|uniref:Odorant receptor n=1 Tax=Fopius arisanus TaxID=64838 RepID=A0A0C9QI15_9HYME|nr:PREDICTED: odorant receptor 82a-like isoform X2 [Fopius arisanus]